MRRILLRVAYDGTRYHGWQIQDNMTTIEGCLNQALTNLLAIPVQVAGASRTDAGVHAYDNVAVFDTDSRIPAEKFAPALNARLPEDIVVQASIEVEPDFHPRYAQSRKTYEYRILNRKYPLPGECRFAHFVYGRLELDAMRQAAGYIVGEHDFACFMAAGSQVRSTVRTVYILDVEKEGDMVYIRVAGNGFLYNMVRIIAGTLLEVGMKRRSPESVKDAIESKDRQMAGPTAPAKGLHLLQLEFENHDFISGYCPSYGVNKIL